MWSEDDIMQSMYCNTLIISIVLCIYYAVILKPKNKHEMFN
jgi:hypothetical protein